MADKTLIEFVRDALSRGAEPDAVRKALEDAGWSSPQIDDAFSRYLLTPFGVPAPRPKAYASARETFLYAILFVLLAIWVFGLGGGLFTLINMLVDSDYSVNAFSPSEDDLTSLRQAIASLVVSFPLFLTLEWRVGRARRRNPGLQRSKVRKWLIYITLFITATILVGDMITVVYRLLDGDVTLRFLLKTAVVFGLAAGVFLFYLPEAETDEDAVHAHVKRSARRNRMFAIVSSAIVAAFVILGVWHVGTPAALVDLRRDDAVLMRLAQVAAAVECHVAVHDAPPAQLSDLGAQASWGGLSDSVQAYCRDNRLVDTDRIDAALTYEPQSATAFRLCADFRLSAAQARDLRGRPLRFSLREGRDFDGDGPYNVVVDADYAAGSKCFDFEARDLASHVDAD